MSTTFTFTAPDEITSREVYHQFYHSMRRALGRSPELALLHTSDDLSARSFELLNGDEETIRVAAADIDLRGCEVVCPALPVPEVVPPVEEKVEEEVVAETTAPAAPVTKRGGRKKSS